MLAVVIDIMEPGNEVRVARHIFRGADHLELVEQFERRAESDAFFRELLRGRPRDGVSCYASTSLFVE